MQRIVVLGFVALATLGCKSKEGTNREAPRPTEPAVAPRAFVASGEDPGEVAGDPEEPRAAPAQPEPSEPSEPSEQPQPSAGGPEFDLKPVRTFDALSGMRPSQDGDLMVGRGCNTLYKTTPYEAIFVFCNDELVAGPLTTVEQIRDVWAQINNAQTSAFELGRSIRARWPSGCSNCRYKIYDQRGNHIGDR